MPTKLINISLNIIILSLLFFNINAYAFERPFEREANKYFIKLLDRKYDELEMDAKKAHETLSLISDGQPRLATIYGGLSGCQFLSCNLRKRLITDVLPFF